MRVLKEYARVRVPATSGNCGPGFDAIGMAHDLWDDVSATLTTGVTRVSIIGEGAKELPRDASHLIVRVMRETMERFGLPLAGIELVCRNSIQQGKGLGSSAAAIVAGLMLVRELTGGEDSSLTKEMMLDIATEYEGHPDNAAPCLYGGATLSWQSSGAIPAEAIHANEASSSSPSSDSPSDDASGFSSDSSFGSDAADTAVHARRAYLHSATHTVQLEVSPEVHTTVLVPADVLPTSEARAVLPQSVPHHDAAAQAAHAGLFVHALARRPDLLFDATEDYLHQRYRAGAMPRSAAMLDALRQAHWPAVISGAGPSILLFAQVDSALAQAVERQGFRVIDSRQVPGAYAVNN
ncbi:MAG: homoserine kinase [Actinomycetaceae bacterium]|nr:homoserine kinase [Arcanobacterium sp.]MDD7687463.1 homoserine kinase [Actinomycetaceae bacterium]MDY5272938.1 homoserine kinase [Arcanobacterium sp.]